MSNNEKSGYAVGRDCALECPANDAARRLYDYLFCHHVRSDGALVGPDPGVSLNLRFTRFVKSYLRFLPWRDRMYYLQGQAYWIADNIEMHKIFGKDEFLDRAIACAEVVAKSQTDEGYWRYPQAEWKGRVATVEGCFGALSLLSAYDVSRNSKYLDGAVRWFDYMRESVGFQDDGHGGLAVNYFSNARRGMVPNNATLALWFEGTLARATGEKKHSEHVQGLISFLARHQKESGEMPYVVGSSMGEGRMHYLCFQYNAFQFLDLAHYYAITNDSSVLRIMKRLGEFLEQALTIDGDARYDCSRDTPTIHYFTAAVAAALFHAACLGFGGHDFVAERACSRLCSIQRPDGSYDYSWGDYGVLSDRRSYPRNQAMILRHLLIMAGNGRLTNGESR